ncbi:MAG: 7-cyano-7-deazaguanine synthase QueC [Gammaproteobacteria bacterium]|jgi:7-cyano-7-deazaguanine synthase|nr:7-cyano-7-deazaguanine synthase QueC [Gammaproteobacteria bacterium]
MGTAKSTAAKAVVLISGGLDSATCLAIAKQQGFECYALSFNYGQRHLSELKAAAYLAKNKQVVEHKTIPIDMSGIGGSALTDFDISVPEAELEFDGIPITYVPARNTVFLSYALGWAEVLGADAIFIGVNALDYSGYPDCRPDFIEAFQKMANLATRVGVEGREIKIETPLIHLSKAQIIQQGITLGVDYSKTVSCYQADQEGKACGRCDSCRLRMKGFLDAGIADPTFYKGL